eukprot:TRINITY_DN10547_c0_g1_i2.p1 TRINITY_DN10547_c0_g1~~TRINITY_DN10547_c0_g1_i2.p1  ORF type:complete len:193 (+),score=24.57 TRINITY_DN10547_c0_g1_i2:257-835(+)
MQASINCVKAGKWEPHDKDHDGLVLRRLTLTSPWCGPHSFGGACSVAWRRTAWPELGMFPTCRQQMARMDAAERRRAEARAEAVAEKDLDPVYAWWPSVDDTLSRSSSCSDRGGGGGGGGGVSAGREQSPSAAYFDPLHDSSDLRVNVLPDLSISVDCDLPLCARYGAPPATGILRGSQTSQVGQNQCGSGS